MGVSRHFSPEDLLHIHENLTGGGKVLKPFFNFPGQNLTDIPAGSLEDETYVTHSASGYMDEELFSSGSFNSSNMSQNFEKLVILSYHVLLLKQTLFTAAYHASISFVFHPT
jgi:hypothetical protein